MSWNSHYSPKSLEFRVMNEEKFQKEEIIRSSAYHDKSVFFREGKTRSTGFRLEQLRKLKRAVKKYEPDIFNALQSDLGKPEFEAYVSEIGLFYSEINYAIKKLRKWIKPKKRKTPLVHFPSVSRIVPDPYGVVLIVSPWNFPFQLLLVPLVGAIAAGNCAVLKPSGKTPLTASVIERIIKEVFDSSYVSVVPGRGAVTIPFLLSEYRFDYIFFTGSAAVAREVARLAAEKDIPVTIESGGKNPVVVDKNVRLRTAVRRVVWAKFFNAGQSCIAPDYLLIHKEVKEDFLALAREQIHHYFGTNPISSASLCHIIDDSHMETLVSYLNNGTVYCGGSYSLQKRIMEPTIIDHVDPDSPVMQEEVFGPVLPVITYEHYEEALNFINRSSHPLALYLYSSDKKLVKSFLMDIQSGGACINNSIIHFVNPSIPFGGIGSSGRGQYHGEYSFNTFTHFKSVMKTAAFFDLSVKFPPYTRFDLKFIRRFLE